MRKDVGAPNPSLAVRVPNLTWSDLTHCRPKLMRAADWYRYGQDSEDWVHDALEIAWNARAKFVSGPVVRWVGVILKFRGRTMRRHEEAEKRYQAEFSLIHPPPRHTEDEAILHLTLVEALHHLARYQQPHMPETYSTGAQFVLLAAIGLEHREIAKLFGIAQPLVKDRIALTRQWLRWDMRLRSEAAA